MKKEEKYRVRSHTFKGYEDYGNGDGSYMYEISFNKSLEHTGKFRGIEDGLNRYDKHEPWEELGKSIIRAFWMFIIGIKRLFQ